ncbi:MAG: helix-turn-helix domain-containing protein, partial [Bacteroidales bacterium]|nr:helix-turn-helix domain-containing protein [Bacteroidales bacterium]
MEKSCYFCASFQKNAKMGQLNQMQRYAISLMLKEKKTQSAIAEAIGVNKSTVS